MHRREGIADRGVNALEVARRWESALNWWRSRRSANLDTGRSSHHQRDDLRRVLLQAVVADLGESELAFGHPERMLDMVRSFSGARLGRPPSTSASYVVENSPSICTSASLTQVRMGRKGWFCRDQHGQVGSADEV